MADAPKIILTLAQLDRLSGELLKMSDEARGRKQFQLASDLLAISQDQDSMGALALLLQTARNKAHAIRMAEARA